MPRSNNSGGWKTVFLLDTAQPDRSHRGLRTVGRIMPIGLLAIGLAGCGTSGAADSKSTVTATAVTTVTATQTAPAAPSSVLSTSAQPPTKQAETSQPSSVQTGVVPNVVGLNHQLAQDTMQAAGFFSLAEEDATGKGRLLINDRNWVVVTQQPAGGTRAPADTTIILRSKKNGE